jgi:hypothetical protein
MIYHTILEDYQCAIEAADSDYQLSFEDPKNVFLQLEEILGQEIKSLNKDSGRYLDLARRAQIWGTFLGETIRYRLGGYWLSDQPDLVLSVFRREIRPVAYIKERFEGICTVAVPEFYHKLLAEIKLHLDQAEFGSREGWETAAWGSKFGSRAAGSVGIKELLAQ